MNVTRENITCRKCRAVGIQNFKRGPVYVEGGDCLDVISCRICGDWYANKMVTGKMQREIEPVKDRGLATCHVAGCGNYISANPAQNKTGLCTTCSNRMTVWRAKGSKDLPPLIRTASGYITRVAYLAAQPQEVTPAESTATAPVTPRQRGGSRISSFPPCTTPGCTRLVQPSRVATGSTICCRCRQTAARRAAVSNPQEVHHVEVTKELPCLAPPAPPAPAVRHQPRRAPLLRRDDHESVALQPLAADWENAPQPPALAQLLSAIGLPVPVDVITCHWQPAERVEVKEFALAVQRKSRRHVPPMPDVLVPFYDSAYAKRSA